MTCKFVCADERDRVDGAARRDPRTILFIETEFEGQIVYNVERIVFPMHRGERRVTSVLCSMKNAPFLVLQPHTLSLALST